jgi:hypothetical protein
MTEKRPTFAQLRLLKRLADAPGSELVILADEASGYNEVPKFHGRFYFPPCPTCHHATFEPVSWLPIHALAQSGLIASRLRGFDHYPVVTPAGYAVLERAARNA